MVYKKHYGNVNLFVHNNLWMCEWWPWRMNSLPQTRHPWIWSQNQSLKSESEGNDKAQGYATSGSSCLPLQQTPYSGLYKSLILSTIIWDFTIPSPCPLSTLIFFVVVFKFLKSSGLLNAVLEPLWVFVIICCVS